MLVIVANRYDTAAEALARRWSAHDAHLLSCEDLSVVGWCHCLTDPSVSTAVIGGRVIGIESITGVLTLLPWVTADQLAHIVPEDRAYVAAEMMAFLVSWLSELNCNVLNHPTPACLMGPAWRPEQWVHAAAGIGIPVRAIGRRVTLTAEPPPENEFAKLPSATVSVVGNSCIGETHGALTLHARRLADATGVDMLAVHFDSPEADARLLGASLRPDIFSPQIADAILETLGRSYGC
jgi:hypothetical protein